MNPSRRFWSAAKIGMQTYSFFFAVCMAVVLIAHVLIFGHSIFDPLWITVIGIWLLRTILRGIIAWQHFDKEHFDFDLRRDHFDAAGRWVLDYGYRGVVEIKSWFVFLFRSVVWLGTILCLLLIALNVRGCVQSVNRHEATLQQKPPYVEPFYARGNSWGTDHADTCVVARGPYQATSTISIVGVRPRGYKQDYVTFVQTGEAGIAVGDTIVVRTLHYIQDTTAPALTFVRYATPLHK